MLKWAREGDVDAAWSVTTEQMERAKKRNHDGGASRRQSERTWFGKYPEVYRVSEDEV